MKDLPGGMDEGGVKTLINAKQKKNLVILEKNRFYCNVI